MPKPSIRHRRAGIAGLSLFLLLLLLLLALMACQGPQDPASLATPTTEAVAGSPEAPTPLATATPAPAPSPTPTPSPTVAPVATPAPQPTEIASLASPVATPVAPALPVGQKQTYANGTTVTVHAVEPYTAGVPSVQLGPNDRLLAIDVEVCAGPQVSDLIVSATQVSLEMANGSAYPGLSTGRNPLLRSQGMLPNACTRGWTTVQLPKSPDPRYVTVALHNYEPARWVFPAS